MASKSKLLVAIPAYNCERQIGRVLSKFDKDVQGLIDTVMVVDNQSLDKTVENAIECSKSLKNVNFLVWQNAQNYGLGGSQKLAFNYAQKNGYTGLVILHGDDQADIRDALAALRGFESFGGDCLLGARFHPKSLRIGYSYFRTFGNLVFNLLFSIPVCHLIYDLGSGLNIYKFSNGAVFDCLRFPDDLTFNYVFLLSSYARQQHISYFPISWREEDQVSNVKLFKQAIKVLGILMLYSISKNKFLKKEWRLRSGVSYRGKLMHSSIRDN